MTTKLETKLRACTSLPSPPKVAARIVQLANDPEADIEEVTKVLSRDPAIASKILRTANSSVYPYPKKVENLGQAMMVLGLNATISLALSFSLVKTLREGKSEGLDYPLFWRRALLAGAVSRALGEACGITDTDELFMAALLQDIGMLALDRVFPGLYADTTLDQALHASVHEFERQRIGVDHAAVGGWLLGKWNLPERLQLAVASSEEPDRVPSVDGRGLFVRCVSLSGMIANLYLVKADDVCFTDLACKAENWLGLTREGLTNIFKQMGALISEAEALFGIDILKGLDPELILENAREALLIRNLQALQQIDALRKNTFLLEFENQRLEDDNRYDALTGTFNRAYLNKFLEEAFEKASCHHEPLSIAFVDMDKFKSVNDTYGHHAGDRILEAASKILMSCVRATDLVGRYGGEEFVVVLPGADSVAATIVGQRIVEAFRIAQHEVGTERPLQVTVSVGISTYSSGREFVSVSELLGAADGAMYAAKSSGGDRLLTYDNTLACSDHSTKNLQ